MSIYKVLCPLYSYIFAKHIYIRININRPEVERMHVLYIFALRCIDLQADKSQTFYIRLCSLLIKLVSLLRSAADRINKSNFRGRCGTVKYHTLLNL